MAFFIHARDAEGCITLRRESREAADKKAEELRAIGYFEVEIVEQAEDKARLVAPAPPSLCWVPMFGVPPRQAPLASDEAFLWSRRSTFETRQCSICLRDQTTGATMSTILNALYSQFLQAALPGIGQGAKR